jgi:hypothetical protein
VNLQISMQAIDFDSAALIFEGRPIKSLGGWPMKFGRRKIALLAMALALVVAGAAGAALEKAEMINGTHWTKWSQGDKLVYIRGISNWADFVAAAQAQTQKGRTWEFCISKVFVEELKTKSLGQIVADVDAYYQANPGKLDTPVIEVVLRRSTKVCPPEPGS